MQIDWITVTAQIVNFLILVWLLKRFLYQPVIEAMDRREKRITDRLADAQEREREADEAARLYEQKQKELEDERDQIMAEAEEEAAEEKKRLTEEAREAVAETRKAWQRQVDQERTEFLSRLRRETADAIENIARRTLHDLASAELEEQIAQSFVKRLKALDEETRQAIAKTSDVVRISSAFELESGMRSRLTRTVHENLAEDLDVEYEQSPELVCGIELTSGGRRLSWSLDGYMDDLADRIEEGFTRMEPEAEGS
ncbi:MAG TPA: hypothetical protein VLS88_01775 [Polyangiales bacterium]|nr:hypothetical protein [Polyangiales bacterium]